MLFFFDQGGGRCSAQEMQILRKADSDHQGTMIHVINACCQRHTNLLRVRNFGRSLARALLEPAAEPEPPSSARVVGLPGELRALVHGKQKCQKWKL